MKIALLNGSPKSQGGASGLILSYLSEKLKGAAELVSCHIVKQGANDVVDAADGCGALAFAFPLYVDGLPSHLIRFLEEAQGGLAHRAAHAKVYVLVNNGFYEARQNTLAIAMMGRFCTRAGLSWGRGVGIGGGGLMWAAPIGHGPLRTLGRALDETARNILALETRDDFYVKPNFPRFLYIFMGHMGWKRQAKKNHLNPRQLYAKNQPR
jgi:multimeric flavodoxin WrbA